MSGGRNAYVGPCKCPCTRARAYGSPRCAPGRDIPAGLFFAFLLEEPGSQAISRHPGSLDSAARGEEVPDHRRRVTRRWRAPWDLPARWPGPGANTSTGAGASTPGRLPRGRGAAPRHPGAPGSTHPSAAPVSSATTTPMPAGREYPCPRPGALMIRCRQGAARARPRDSRCPSRASGRPPRTRRSRVRHGRLTNRSRTAQRPADRLPPAPASGEKAPTAPGPWQERDRGPAGVHRRPASPSPRPCPRKRTPPARAGGGEVLRRGSAETR